VIPQTKARETDVSADRIPVTSGSRGSRGHVPSADVVRVLTFACVIAVHTLSTTHRLDDPRADGLVMALHFTREAFFVLTAFVLMHRYSAAPPRTGGFWRRRFLLVGVPYVAWSAVYTGLQGFAWTGTALVFSTPRCGPSR
jgi:acyltransferase-like protein